MYEKMIAQMEQENSDIVFCSFVRFWPNGKVQYTHEENFSKLISNPGDIQYFLYSTPPQKENDHLYTKDIHGSVCRSVFIRTIIIQHCIRFNLELSFAEDQIFMLDYLNCCRKISWCPNPFLHYRGWTKTPKYHGYYDNHMLLVRNQKRIVSANGYYSPAQKRRIISYLECSAYFAIIKEVLITIRLRIARDVNQYLIVTGSSSPGCLYQEILKSVRRSQSGSMTGLSKMPFSISVSE